MKGLPFLSKMVYKSVRIWTLGGTSPCKTLLSTPPPQDPVLVLRPDAPYYVYYWRDGRGWPGRPLSTEVTVRRVQLHVLIIL